MSTSSQFIVAFTTFVAVIVFGCITLLYVRLFEERQWQQNISTVDLSLLSVQGMPIIDSEADEDTTLTPFTLPKTWICSTGAEVSSALDRRNRGFDIVIKPSENQQAINLLSSVYIGAVRWSPHCDMVAVELRGSPQEEIYVYTVQGVLLNAKAFPGRSPTWSPDGQQIVYIAGTGGSKHLYVAKPDGTDIQQLTFSYGYDDKPIWSPDGAWIAFTYEPWDAGLDYFSPSTAIHVIRPDGTERRAITPSSLYLANYPTWSPDSKFIAGNCGIEDEEQRLTVGICVMDVQYAQMAWVQEGSGMLKWQQ